MRIYEMRLVLKERDTQRIFYLKISSTRVQHKVGSRVELWWSPYIVGQWIARVPSDHTWHTITRADEMKRNGWVECGEMVEWNLWQGKTGETPRKPTQTPFRPSRNLHGGTETRTRDPSGRRRASNHLRHEAAIFYLICLKLIVVSLCCNSHKKIVKKKSKMLTPQQRGQTAVWYAETKLQMSV